MSGCPFLHGDEGSAPPPPPTTAAAATGDMQSPNAILGFQFTNKDFVDPAGPPTHYGSYLGIEQLLNLQDGPALGKSTGKGLVHHEELTFIVVHQVFELWFKLVTADMVQSREYLTILASGSNTDAAMAANLVTKCLAYLRRTEAIFHHAVGAFGIMETMHPADFVEFRDYLVPASGFQSVSFRSLEQLLGVQNETRLKVNNLPVFSYLTETEQAQLAEEGKAPSINDLVVRMLARTPVPETFLQVYLETTRKVLEEQQYVIARAAKDDPKAKALIDAGVEKMEATLKDPVAWSEGLHLEGEGASEEYRKAVIAALFITSYRHEHQYSSLATLLDSLIAVEEAMLLWRGRHTHMAERMIGRRSGTGGTSSGVGYLDLTRRYRIFHSLWLVRKMFVRASALPPLSHFQK